MKKATSILILVFLSLSLLNCSQLKRRDQVSSDQKVVSPSSTKEGTDEEFQSLPAQLSQQSAKKIGLILGPGGARTLAYAGLIRAFQKKKLQISHIAATEWASLVGASFALSGEVHDMDWKLYKLESLDLSFKKGFLGFGGGHSSADLSSYLKQNFSQHRIESSSVSFVCASRSLGANQSVILSQGLASDVIQKCLPSPPFFKKFNPGASPASLMKLAHHLKKMGADILVFVDVLDSRVLTEPLIREDSVVRYLWGQILESQDSGLQGVKGRFHLDLNQYSIFDFSKRKQLEEEGERQGSALADRLIEAYHL